jgi:hypothetical protein
MSQAKIAPKESAIHDEGPARVGKSKGEKKEKRVPENKGTGSPFLHPFSPFVIQRLRTGGQTSGVIHRLADIGSHDQRERA